MEKYAVLIVLAVLGFALIKLLLKPIQWGVKLLFHTSTGIAGLLIVNSLSMLSGISIPVNAVTVLTAGSLGIPGIAALTALELIRL